MKNDKMLTADMFEVGEEMPAHEGLRAYRLIPNDEAAKLLFDCFAECFNGSPKVLEDILRDYGTTIKDYRKDIDMMVELETSGESHLFVSLLLHKYPEEIMANGYVDLSYDEIKSLRSLVDEKEIER